MSNRNSLRDIIDLFETIANVLHASRISCFVCQAEDRKPTHTNTQNKRVRGENTPYELKLLFETRHNDHADQKKFKDNRLERKDSVVKNNGVFMHRVVVSGCEELITLEDMILELKRFVVCFNIVQPNCQIALHDLIGSEMDLEPQTICSGSAFFGLYTVRVSVLLHNTLEFGSEGQVSVVQYFNRRIVQDQEVFNAHCSNCFTDSRETRRPVDALTNVEGVEGTVRLEGNRAKLCKAKDSGYLSGFLQKLWPEMSSYGLGMGSADEVCFHSGLLPCCQYYFESENCDHLRSITLILRVETEDEQRSDIPIEAYYTLLQANAKLIQAILARMKEHPASRYLLYSKRERKMQSIQNEYIPIIASSIQEICQLSTNEDFKVQCMQMLNVENIEDISRAIQKQLLSHFEH